MVISTRQTRIGAVVAVLLIAGATIFLLWRRQSGVVGPVQQPAEAVNASPRAPRSAEPVSSVKCRVRGRVVAPDGAGVEGADLAVFRLQGNESELPEPDPDEVFRSQTDGRFEFEVKTARDLAVGARTSGLVSALVPVGDGRRELTLRMANAYEVSGYVSDRFAPLAGCEVVLESEDDRFFAHVTKTGADGAFRFAGIYPGLVAVSARAPQYRPVVQRGVVVGTGKPLRLPLREVGLGLQGRVWLDGPEDVPAVGAKVCATPQRDERVRLHSVPHTTTTGADGSFELIGLGAGLHRVQIAHPQRSTVIRSVDIGSRRSSRLEVRLPPRVSVRGRLVGGELVSTELLLVTEGRERARTRSDTGGRFEFAGQHSTGPATLVLLERSLLFERTLNRRVTVELSQEALSLPVVPALLLGGDVADARGKPIVGAEIYVESEHMPGIDVLREPATVTDGEGRYRLHVARSVAPQLTFWHPAFAPAALALTLQASGVQQTVTLHPPSRIAGRVQRDGKPLPAAIVHLPAESGLRAWATTGPDGVFTLHGVPPGEHQLIVRYGTLTEFSARATVLPGLDVEHAELTLPPGRQLEGRVVDEQGRPVPSALVAVEAGGGVSTDGNGRFVLDVPQGEAVVHVFAPDWRLEETKTVTAADHVVQIVLPVPPHGRLRARLQAVPGRRIVGALLGVQPLEATDATSTALPVQWVDVRDGVLLFDRFPAGRWRVSLRCDGHVPLEVTGSLATGGEWDLGNRILEAGAALRGVVLDTDGKPVPGAQVLLGNEADLFVVTEAARARGDVLFGVRADLRGRFALTGVSSRQRTIVVDGPGFATEETVLKIPADLLRQDPLQVTLRPGVDIVAQVVDARGQPLAGRTVELRKLGFPIDVGRTDGDGRCVFRHRSLGEYRLTALGTAAFADADVQQQQTFHATLRVADR